MLIFLLFSIEGISQVFNGSVYLCTSDSKIIRIDSILTNPSEVLVCNTDQQLLDIGYAPDNSLYGVYGFLGGYIAKVLPDGSFAGELFLPYQASNALSFDQYNKAYVGFDESSVVVTVDMNKTSGTIDEWHNFGTGRAAGDFIFLNNKLYIAWRINSDVHLYEVELGALNQYVSHRDLGLLPKKTYGLASDKQSLIFGVIEDNQVYSFKPPADPVATIPVTYRYTFTLGIGGYGATSKSESFGNTQLDFGDAPQTFQTGGPDSAACHIITSGLCLGKQVDGEDEGIPSTGADSDDINSNINDDDGITYSGFSIQNFTFLKGCTAKLTIEHTGEGYLSAWFDWNRDGAWSDDERVIDGLYLGNGNNEYPMVIPPDAAAGSTYCRFRYSSVIVHKSNFYAQDGEVEDYMINVVEQQTVDSLMISSDNVNSCLGNTLTVPFRSSDFKGVISLRMTLNFDTANLSFLGLTNVYPALEDQLSCAFNNTSGTLTISWIDDAYLSLPDTVTLFDLQFTPLKTGITQINISGGLYNSNSIICNSGTIPLTDKLGRVTVYNPPEAYANEAIELCENNNLLLAGTATGESPVISYQWISPDGTTMDDEIVSLNNVNPSQSGLYGFYCTDAIGCRDSAFTKVTIKQLPEIDFAGNDTLYYAYGYVLKGADLFDYCTWNTGAVTPEIEITQDGQYWVKVGLNGCENTDSVYMLETDRVLFVPNAFTPDNDGINDVFRAIGTASSLQSFNMMIFTRWGNVVFESNDISRGWDGTCNNHHCEAGAYVCIIRYKPRKADGLSELKTIQSTVLLLR